MTSFAAEVLIIVSKINVEMRIFIIVVTHLFFAESIIKAFEGLVEM